MRKLLVKVGVGYLTFTVTLIAGFVVLLPLAEGARLNIGTAFIAIAAASVAAAFKAARLIRPFVTFSTPEQET